MALYVSFDCESCENENCTGKGLKSTVYKCSGYKHKQTNADRIRAMSDEELAEFIGGIYTLERDAWGDYDPCVVVESEKIRDKGEMLDWLKQEVDSGPT